LQCFETARHIKLPYNLCRPDGWLKLTASTFNGLKPVCKQYCSHGALLSRTCRFFTSGGKNHRRYSLHLLTEGWPGWVGPSALKNTVIVDQPKVTSPSSNRARRSTFMSPTSLALWQTSHHYTLYINNTNRISYQRWTAGLGHHLLAQVALRLTLHCPQGLEAVKTTNLQLQHWNIVICRSQAQSRGPKHCTNQGMTATASNRSQRYWGQQPHFPFGEQDEFFRFITHQWLMCLSADFLDKFNSPPVVPDTLGFYSNWPNNVHAWQFIVLSDFVLLFVCYDKRHHHTTTLTRRIRQYSHTANNKRTQSNHTKDLSNLMVQHIIQCSENCSHMAEHCV